MRTSDTRYRHVQRKKRPAFDYTALIDAVRAAKAGDLDPLEQAVSGSAAEFTHVLLATGRTANDFRRNFRVGSHAVHILRSNELVEHDALRAEKLDGYVMMRLSREQHKNVKLRWAKLRDQDRLLHDPQGEAWMTLLRGWAGAIGQDQILEHVSYIRDTGTSVVERTMVKLAADEDGLGGLRALDREFRELMRDMSGSAMEAEITRDAARRKEIARESFDDAVRYHRDREKLWGAKWDSVDEWRKAIETRLVAAEAFLDGRGFERALCNPDTSKRHSTEAQLLARFNRVAEAFGITDMGICVERSNATLLGPNGVASFMAELNADRSAKGGGRLYASST